MPIRPANYERRGGGTGIEPLSNNFRIENVNLLSAATAQNFQPFTINVPDNIQELSFVGREEENLIFTLPVLLELVTNITQYFIADTHNRGTAQQGGVVGRSLAIGISRTASTDEYTISRGNNSNEAASATRLLGGIYYKRITAVK